MTNYLITAAFVVALIVVARWVVRERRALDRDNREGERRFKLHLREGERYRRSVYRFNSGHSR